MSYKTTIDFTGLWPGEVSLGDESTIWGNYSEKFREGNEKQADPLTLGGFLCLLLTMSFLKRKLKLIFV